MANKTLKTLSAATSVFPGDLLLTRQGTDTSDTKLTVDQLKTFMSYQATLIAPTLGVPASGTLLNCTGLPDSGLTLTDVTTNNVSTARHGLVPKAPNDAAQVLLGTGAWGTVPVSTPAGMLTYNHFDNPDFEVNQEKGPGETSWGSSTDPSAKVNLADRWKGWLDESSVPHKISFTRALIENNGALVGSNSRYEINITHENNGQSFKAVICQRFTSGQVRKMGDTLTATVNVQFTGAGTDCATYLRIYSANSLDGFSGPGLQYTSSFKTPAGGSVWSKLTFTVTGVQGLSNVKNGLEFQFYFDVAPLTGVAAGIRIADVLLNDGASAATFANPTLTESEARCFPFYQKTFSRDVAVADGSESYPGCLVVGAVTTSYLPIYGMWRFAVPMRTIPNIYRYNLRGGGTAGYWMDGTNDIPSAPGTIGTSGCCFYMTSGTLTAGNFYCIHASADARL